MKPADRRGARLLALAVIPAVLALSACGDDDKEQASKAASSPCPSSLGTASTAALPSNLPAPAGATAYGYFTQGKTRIWQLAVDGGASDLVRLRDGYDRALTAAGYAIKGTDQEPGAEAESEFAGPHAGTTRWRPLCSGKDYVQVKVTS